MEPGMIGLGRMRTSLVHRGEADYAGKRLSAMRSWFGGHAEKTTTPKGTVS